MSQYIRKDIEGGMLYNDLDIQYFKQVQLIEIIDNKLLGDYNEKGEYVTQEDIIKELIALKKVKTYTYGDTVFCQSISNIGGFGRVDFAVKLISDMENGKFSAQLELLENISKANGYYSNTNAVLIATFTSSRYSTFAVDCFKAFNIVDTAEGGRVEDDFEPNAILARKKYLAWLKTQLDPKLVPYEKDLLEKRLKALKRSQVGEVVYQQFVNEMQKLKGVYIKDQLQSYFRAANDVLDRLIQLRFDELSTDENLMKALNKASAALVSQTKNIYADIRVDGHTANKTVINEQKVVETNTTKEKAEVTATSTKSSGPSEYIPTRNNQVKAVTSKNDAIVLDDLRNVKTPEELALGNNEQKSMELVDADALAGTGGLSDEVPKDMSELNNRADKLKEEVVEEGF